MATVNQDPEFKNSQTPFINPRRIFIDKVKHLLKILLNKEQELETKKRLKKDFKDFKNNTNKLITRDLKITFYLF